MKKRTRILWSIVGVLVLLVRITGFVLAQVFQTRSPNAVTEADGVYMEWVEEPTRDNLTFRICNESDRAVYGGQKYVVEYDFLGGWYMMVRHLICLRQ